MMSAQVFWGASLFALLAMSVHCGPVKKGNDPSGSYGGGHTNDYGYGASSGSYAPGDASYNAPAEVVSRGSYQPVPQPEPQPAVHRAPAAPAAFSSVSGPAESGHSSERRPFGAVPPGAAHHPGSRETEWAVAPPSFSGGARPAAAAASGYVSPPFPPPEPLYQAGELAHSEHSFESGDFERETEETGSQPPLPPLYNSPGPSHTSPPYPMPGPMPGPMPYPGWGFYPHYDYMFLTGQYPPGTFTHASSSFEQGRDHWQDVHYVRDHYPQNSPSVPQAEPVKGQFAPRQSVKAAGPPITPYGKGAAGGSPGPSHGRPAQAPGRHMDYNRDNRDMG